MLQANNKYLVALTSPRRSFSGSAILEGSTTPIEVKHTDNLKGFKVDRVGENGKFFGFGITQKLTLELLDKARAYKIEDYKTANIKMGAGGLEELTFTPVFWISHSETKRDEVTNDITVVAYDALGDASKITLNDVGVLESLGNDYTITEFIEVLANKLNIDGFLINSRTFGWQISYPDGANLDGTETIREVLDDIAEITQTFYFVNYRNQLEFKGISTTRVGTIDKSQYMELTSGDELVLTGLAITNELGDNLVIDAGDGITQEIKDNAFLEMREDKAELLSSFIDDVIDADMTPFNLTWRGNFLFEIGDRFNVANKDDKLIAVYLFNDTLTYNGGLSQKTQWEGTEGFNGHSNPANLGEAIKETYAKVDKVNKQVEIVASVADSNTAAISSLKLDTESINANVKRIEETALPGVEGELEQLRQEVAVKVSPDQLSIEIQKEIGKSTKAVETTTGFTFNDEGLTIEKDSSEIKTQITEDGMTVYKNGGTVLTANNQGVKAKDLHAVTFLIIGNNSRFEDYDNRTGCFWIGGNS